MMKSVLLLFSVWCTVNLVYANVKGLCKSPVKDRSCQYVQALAKDTRDFSSIYIEFPNAVTMDFHGSLMETFDGSKIRNFQNLQTLNLSYNLLANNAMQNIQNSFLKTVDLKYNEMQFVSVPRTVENFIAQRNNLTNIQFQYNNNLKVLMLSQNKFEEMKSFTNLNQLIELDLSCNKIKNVDFNILSAMRNLKKLSLSRNHISTFSGDNTLNKLEELNLSNNLLTNFDMTNKLPNLKVLNLSGNKIVIVFGIYRTLSAIDLRENDLDCKHLTTFKESHSVNFKQDGVCSGDSIRHSSQLCCSESKAPYADRLISYQKRKFQTLQKSATQIEYGANCSSYEPDPCDGDKGLTKKVAAEVIRDMQSLFLRDYQSVEKLVSDARDNLEKTKQNFNTMQDTYMQFSQEINDLRNYIDNEYALVGLARITNPIEQINDMFEEYDRIHTNIRELIRKEEVEIGDKLDEEQRIRNEIQEVELDINAELEELKSRNETVNALRQKLADNQAKLKKRQNT